VLVLQADVYDTLQVGVQPDGRIVVPTNQILKPAGMQITFPGRPVDLAFADDGQTLVVKNMRDLVFIDVATSKVKQTLALPTAGKPRPGFSVVGLLVQHERVFASDAQNQVRVARRDKQGYEWMPGLDLAKPKVKGEADPAGLALTGDNDL